MHKTRRPPQRPNKRETRTEALPKRINRRRRNWNRAVRRVAGAVFVLEMAILLFANPHLEVTHVQITGLQTLGVPQVFAEAQVPARTNIFWMVLHEPFRARLQRDPVIDHVSESISLPRTLALHVTERQPYAALEVADAVNGDQWWLLDKTRVPFRTFALPPPGVPLLQWQGQAPPIALGRPLADPRLSDAYTLMALVAKDPQLAVQKITVDQNANLCLNSVHHLQIKLGQPDLLPQKVALAQRILRADNGNFATQIACLDLSSPEQPVYTTRAEAKGILTEARAERDSQESYGQ